MAETTRTSRLTMSVLLSVALAAGLVGGAVQSPPRAGQPDDLRYVASSEPEPDRWGARVVYNPATGKWEGLPFDRPELDAREGQVDRYRPRPPAHHWEDQLDPPRYYEDNSVDRRTPAQREEDERKARRGKQNQVIPKDGVRAGNDLSKAADNLGKAASQLPKAGTAVPKPGPAVQGGQSSAVPVRSGVLAVTLAITAARHAERLRQARADERRRLGRVDASTLRAAKKAQQDAARATTAIQDAARARATAEQAAVRAARAEEQARRSTEQARTAGSSEARQQSRTDGRDAKAARKEATRSAARAQQADRVAQRYNQAYVAAAGVEVKQKAHDGRKAATTASRAADGAQRVADRADRAVRQAEQRLAAARAKDDPRAVAKEERRVEKARKQSEQVRGPLKKATTEATIVARKADELEAKVRKAEQRARDDIARTRDKAHATHNAPVSPVQGKKGSGDPPDDPPAKTRPRTDGPKGSGGAGAQRTPDSAGTPATTAAKPGGAAALAKRLGGLRGGSGATGMGLELVALQWLEQQDPEAFAALQGVQDQRERESLKYLQESLKDPSTRAEQIERYQFYQGGDPSYEDGSVPLISPEFGKARRQLFEQAINEDKAAQRRKDEVARWDSYAKAKSAQWESQQAAGRAVEAARAKDAREFAADKELRAQQKVKAKAESKKADKVLKASKAKDDREFRAA
ncbi:hypothetical protein ACGFIQ_15610, partial [Micromonospora sp. NPDC048898]